MSKEPTHFDDFDLVAISDRAITAAMDDVLVEVLSAKALWPPFNSAHEGYGVLDEEFEELKKHVFMKQKNRDLDAMRKEAIQVAAMAVRFASELCTEERGRK